MTEFIIPPQKSNTTNKVVFLAGPVLGAEDWQQQVYNTIKSDLAPDVDIVSPRGANQLYTEESDWLKSNKQIEWEKHYLERAREMGTLVMWFAAQEYNTPGRSFAQTSRIEFGRMIGWKDSNSEVDIILGIDSNYSGGNENYIRHTAKEHNITVQSSLKGIISEILNRHTL